MHHSLITLAGAAALALASSSQAALIAYWDQNSNSLPNAGGFGFLTSAFPQPADQGNGALRLADFLTDTTTTSGDVFYTFIQSFGGDTLNAQAGVSSGGSLSPQGGTSNGNNGMAIILEVSTLGFTDISVSWAQRGTSTGFDSRTFDYSLDGSSWTNFGTDLGDLTSTWEVQSYDLSAVSAIENQSTVFFRIVLDGATNSSGNNRFDNITIAGVPEPSAFLISSIGGLVLLRRRR